MLVGEREEIENTKNAEKNRLYLILMLFLLLFLFDYFIYLQINTCFSTCLFTACFILGLELTKQSLRVNQRVSSRLHFNNYLKEFKNFDYYHVEILPSCCVHSSNHCW